MKEELKQMDQRIRKLVTMHSALHPRGNVCVKQTVTDNMYQEMKEEEDLQTLKTAWRIDTTTQRLHRKAQRKTNYSQQKQHWQHEDQQNDNN